MPYKGTVLKWGARRGEPEVEGSETGETHLIQTYGRKTCDSRVPADNTAECPLCRVDIVNGVAW